MTLKGKRFFIIKFCPFVIVSKTVTKKRSVGYVTLKLFIASWLKITSDIKVFLNEVYPVLNKTTWAKPHIKLIKHFEKQSIFNREIWNAEKHH